MDGHVRPPLTTKQSHWRPLSSGTKAALQRIKATLSSLKVLFVPFYQPFVNAVQKEENFYWYVHCICVTYKYLHENICEKGNELRKKPTHQSINQSINRSINAAINQPINQEINWPEDQTKIHSINQEELFTTHRSSRVNPDLSFPRKGKPWALKQ